MNKLPEKCKYYNEDTVIILKIIRELYQLPDCGAGGMLHIVLDDGNMKREHLEFCLRECLNNPDKPESKLGASICRMLIGMLLVERKIIYAALGNFNGLCEDQKCHECVYLEGLFD